MPGRRLKVVMACPGVGRERRGFETFAEELFRAFRDDERLDVRLAKSAGPWGPGHVRVPSLARRTRPARIAGRIVRRGDLWAEQASFSAFLAPRLLSLRPDVVYMSEWAPAVWLGRWRDVARLRFGVLLSNGGSYMAPYDRFDHVQQLTELHRADALAAGEPPERHTVVPYGFSIPRKLPAPAERERLRARLSLPRDRPIVVSVGALDTTIKRHDVVVRAVSCTRGRPFLVLLGQRGPETPQLEALTASLLDPTDYLIATAEPEDVSAYDAAADVFVLASLREGMGRAAVEACAAGLPCIVHDHPVMREVLGGAGRYVDATDVDAIAVALDDELERSGDPERAEDRRRAMFERYDWSSLRDRYVELCQRGARRS